MLAERAGGVRALYLFGLEPRGFFSLSLFFFFFLTTPVYKLIQILKFPIQLRLTDLQTLPAEKKPKTLRHQSSGVSIAGAVTKVLWRQTRACRDRHVFVTAKHVFCRDKGLLVATKLCLSLQAYFGLDKRRALLRQARACRDKSIFLSRGKTCLS